VTAVTDAFWIDYEYDQAQAGGGKSRFCTYVRQNRSAFQDIWYDDPTDSAAAFAAAAWRIARGPIMAPPYVRSHHRIMAAQLSRSGWDGGLVADVALVAYRPQSLRDVRHADDGYYGSWRRGLAGTYEMPGEDDVARGPYLLCTARLLTTLPTGTLPAFDGVLDDLEVRAADAVAAIIPLLNREIGPLIEAMEGGDCRG
jgi:hypothetical protein